ncbi:MAG: type II toxin-antitoxin system VapC family toxin [bacterium]|nr:type II toxin-antitoxin system VapC family toxin [bacterium]
MVYLVDTNVLIHLSDRRDPHHPIVRAALRKLRRDGHQLQISPQNCAEFWNVATRPAEHNGLGLTPVDADRALKLIERLFPVLSDNPSVYSEWRRLVVDFEVSGVQIHDTRLVAMMKTNGITHILTFNRSDFARYAQIGIVAADPATV